MNPKEKANSLLYLIEWELMGENRTLHKKLALIMVNEILGCDAIRLAHNKETEDEKRYWEQVQQEIELA